MKKLNLKNIIKTISWLSLIYGAYIIIKVMIARANLPEGVCPLDDNRPDILLGVFLIIGSMAVEVVYDKLIVK